MKNKVERVYYALIGLVIFSVAGYYIPKIYYEYLDTRDYYTVKQPVGTDKKEYKPCEYVTLLLDRKSTIKLQGHAVTELIKIENGDAHRKKTLKTTYISIDAADRNVIIAHEIPCQTSDGVYFISTNIEYQFRGATKNYTWITGPFNVKR